MELALHVADAPPSGGAVRRVGVEVLPRLREVQAVRLAGTTVDCRDVGVVSGFWSALLEAPLREPLPAGGGSGL